MSGDDDDGTVIIIRRKAQKIKESLSKAMPAVKRWHLVALGIVAFVAGAWIF